MRSRACLRMALEAERRSVSALDSLQRSVEERPVCRLQAGRKRVLVNREAVVLARDHYPAGLKVLDRVVRAVMAELHLDGLRAGGEGQELVPEADAEYRHLLLKDLPDGLDGVGAGLRIAGAGLYICPWRRKSFVSFTPRA